MIRSLGLSAVIAFLGFVGSLAQAQSFSCSEGDSGVCLQAGETVCSALGQCVSDNAVCFDRIQCDHEGFTCRSDVTECTAEIAAVAEQMEALQARYAELQAEYRELAEASAALIDDYDDLIECVRDMPVSGDVIDCTY
ncbi:hypothetical protein [Pelagovum pacificum]|uniref:Uncharacterized protein n=1 Tax=Pelagovum pacificum TaxID=2588711 RepID=A0A5C5GBF2_9RHOB|nr:hypothetical protein [Pelagovum pacificum]QQA42215.1 hypothetical protein I8N54_15675 [Pelagovum pacificum]TNY31302.1 hypothetical protein FHY64_14865 [Pelagovum pacificum]